MEIEESARKHGVADGDMLYAYRHHWLRVETDDTAVNILVGPSTTGAPLEIAVARRGADTAIIHAMSARKRFLRGWRIR